MPPGHPIILPKRNKFNRAAVSVKRSISKNEMTLYSHTNFWFFHHIVQITQHALTTVKGSIYYYSKRIKPTESKWQGKTLHLVTMRFTFKDPDVGKIPWTTAWKTYLIRTGALKTQNALVRKKGKKRLFISCKLPIAHVRISKL